MFMFIQVLPSLSDADSGDLMNTMNGRNRRSDYLNLPEAVRPGRVILGSITGVVTRKTNGILACPPQIRRIPLEETKPAKGAAPKGEKESHILRCWHGMKSTGWEAYCVVKESKPGLVQACLRTSSIVDETGGIESGGASNTSTDIYRSDEAVATTRCSDFGKNAKVGIMMDGTAHKINEHYHHQNTNQNGEMGISCSFNTTSDTRVVVVAPSSQNYFLRKNDVTITGRMTNQGDGDEMFRTKLSNGYHKHTISPNDVHPTPRSSSSLSLSSSPQEADIVGPESIKVTLAKVLHELEG
eukprot:jgi/Bigna1/147219/aug1.133_g21927